LPGAQEHGALTLPPHVFDPPHGSENACMKFPDVAVASNVSVERTLRAASSSSSCAPTMRCLTEAAKARL
jgi:hypothetical protein